ncbi:rho guanyl-nucleotide exchange factor [Moniliophthora roreri]|nr:rho guanyl-nucleotide exchange factor [Moniliophthora roreri]
MALSGLSSGIQLEFSGFRKTFSSLSQTDQSVALRPERYPQSSQRPHIASASSLGHPVAVY